MMWTVRHSGLRHRHLHNRMTRLKQIFAEFDVLSSASCMCSTRMVRSIKLALDANSRTDRVSGSLLAKEPFGRQTHLP